jgi:hypothetical protein
LAAAFGHRPYPGAKAQSAELENSSCKGAKSADTQREIFLPALGWHRAWNVAAVASRIKQISQKPCIHSHLRSIAEFPQWA